MTTTTAAMTAKVVGSDTNQLKVAGEETMAAGTANGSCVGNNNKDNSQLEAEVESAAMATVTATATATSTATAGGGGRDRTTTAMMTVITATSRQLR